MINVVIPIDDFMTLKKVQDKLAIEIPLLTIKHNRYSLTINKICIEKPKISLYLIW